MLVNASVCVIIAAVCSGCVTSSIATHAVAALLTACCRAPLQALLAVQRRRQRRRADRRPCRSQPHPRHRAAPGGRRTRRPQLAAPKGSSPGTSMLEHHNAMQYPARLASAHSGDGACRQSPMPRMSRFDPYSAVCTMFHALWAGGVGDAIGGLAAVVAETASQPAASSRWDII